MKIAMYTICKNEEKHVERWLRSAAEADGIFVLDTGSEDRTRELFQDRVNLHVATFHPFRFDTARNMILNQIPEDYDLAVFLDLDEQLEPGWRAKIEAITVPYDSLSFRMIFNREADGAPGLVYHRVQAHRLNKFVWMYPAHEILFPLRPDTIELTTDIEVEHLPDREKSRSDYLSLLETGAQEMPHDQRMCQYLAREYMYREQYHDAILQYTRHLEICREPALRSESYRNLARCYQQTYSESQAEFALLRALAETPYQREPYGELSSFYQQQGDTQRCLAFALACLSIPESERYILRERKYYREWPHHMAAWAYEQLGARDLSIEHIKKAVNLNPLNPHVLQDYVNMTGELPVEILQKIDNKELKVSYESPSSGN